MGNSRRYRNGTRTVVSRLDVESLLRMTRFEVTEYPGMRLWEHSHYDLKYVTYTDADRSPTTYAKWLVGEVRRWGLLPERRGENALHGQG